MDVLIKRLASSRNRLGVADPAQFSQIQVISESWFVSHLHCLYLLPFSVSSRDIMHHENFTRTLDDNGCLTLDKPVFLTAYLTSDILLQHQKVPET